ncbi:hypothetical protein COBT_001458 [Conglomerata obtusa]
MLQIVFFVYSSGVLGSKQKSNSYIVNLKLKINNNEAMEHESLKKESTQISEISKLNNEDNEKKETVVDDPEISICQYNDIARYDKIKESSFKIFKNSSFLYKDDLIDDALSFTEQSNFDLAKSSKFDYLMKLLIPEAYHLDFSDIIKNNDAEKSKSIKNVIVAKGKLAKLYNEIQLENQNIFFSIEEYKKLKPELGMIYINWLNVLKSKLADLYDTFESLLKELLNYEQEMKAVFE